MAVLQVSYYTTTLMRSTVFHAVIPNDLLPDAKRGNPHYERPMKTLYLLHGYAGNSNDWLVNCNVSDLAAKYNLAIIMPTGENSFYLNGKGTGSAYETLTGQELVAYTRNMFGLSCKREDTYIGGLSMGGFGAIHTGLKYPENFGKMVGLSSALITKTLKDIKPGTNNGIADYDYYVRVFGDLEQVESGENSPNYLVKHRREKGETIQPIFIACGKDDFLIEQNREFVKLLEEQGVDCTYRESEGVHDWNFWNKTIEPAIQWLLQD
jgi:S-formylglutathione hydrolase FrmB